MRVPKTTHSAVGNVTQGEQDVVADPAPGLAGQQQNMEGVDSTPSRILIATERRSDGDLVEGVMRQQLMGSPVRNDRAVFEERVHAAGGRVDFYLREAYTNAMPDRTLCGPLSSLWLLHGTHAVAGDARHGFETTSGLRRRLDDIQGQLAGRQQELRSVNDRIDNFERDYYAVDHGPTHHSVKQREMKSLRESRANLEREIPELLQAGVQALWQGRLGEVRGAPTTRFANMLNDLAAPNPGRYYLNFDRSGSTGHILGLEVERSGQVRLFDPDWGTMTFANMHGANQYLGGMLAQDPSFLNGRVMLGQIRD